MSDATLVRTTYAAQLRRLAATGLLATVVAMVVTALAAALLKALGVDFVVDGGEIPVAGFASITGLFSVVGIVIAAALLRWSARPAEHFVRIALALTALSLVPPVLWGSGAGTVAGLIVLHLVAAAVMIPALARGLSGRPAPLSPSGAPARG